MTHKRLLVAVVLLAASSVTTQAQFPPGAGCYMPDVVPVSKRAACMKAVKKQIAHTIASDACLNRNGHHMEWIARRIARIRYGWHCFPRGDK